MKMQLDMYKQFNGSELHARTEMSNIIEQI